MTTAAPGPTAGTGAHEPLSVTLTALVENELPPAGLSLNDVLRRTEGRGPYALLVLLCLPFLTPLSLPGFSNAVGVAIMVLAIQIARRRPARLPRAIGDRLLPAERIAKIVKVSVKALRFIEKWVKPRKTRWLSWGAAKVLNASLMATMGFALALPIPPTVPLSNMLPSYSTICLAAAMMEEDGKMIWVAYVCTFFTTVYLTVMIALQAGAIAALAVKYYDRFTGWL